jgi:hypothetical protein
VSEHAPRLISAAYSSPQGSRSLVHLRATSGRLG